MRFDRSEEIDIVRLRKTGDAAEHKIWTWVLV